MSSTPVRILDTDQVDSAIRDGATLDELLRLIFGEPAQSVDAALMLDDIVSFIRRFVSLSPAQACVIALWVGHTHCFSAFDVTPYLSITSAEMQCGKTRLLEILELLVFNPWRTGRGTAAVLIRKIDAERSTVLLDEADAAFGGGRGYTEMLRGLLNTGYERGGVYSSCVGQDSFKDFSTFC